MVLLSVNFLPGSPAARGTRGDTTEDILVNVDVEIIEKNGSRYRVCYDI